MKVYYIQHTKQAVVVSDTEWISSAKHRTLVLSRFDRKDLAVLYNEKLQFRLARRLPNGQYLLLRSKRK